MQDPQVSLRAQELERKYQSRRGHSPQLSISDESHHITEAIGDMYGEHAFDSRRDSRPLSFISAPNAEIFDTPPPTVPHKNPSRSPLHRTNSSERSSPVSNGGSPTSPSFLREPGHLPPANLNRSNSQTAQQPFPLNDIDYESSPAAVAQELSNLQAIRRMSMDVNTSDPDLPGFGSGFAVPSIAPSHSSDEDDASRLFWVPARLHPELAPTEFKTFIEDRVQKIRRRSGGEESIIGDGLSRAGSSSGSLRRKKSMLSRQVKDGHGYRDGAERLERKKSSASGSPNGLENIQELEQLVNDPTQMMRRMSLETIRKSVDSGVEVSPEEDMPILPKPGGPTLKRSTRTTYRRGSVRKGERVPFSRRPIARQSETDTEESPATSPTSASYPDPDGGISRVQTEPMPGRPRAAANFSRPTRKGSSPPPESLPTSESPEPPHGPGEREPDNRPSGQPRKPFHSRIASNGRTTAQLPGVPVPAQTPIPQIVETPPPPAEVTRPGPMYFQPPERKSSHELPPHLANQQGPPRGPLPGRPPANRPPPQQPHMQSQHAPPQHHPQPRMPQQHQQPVQPPHSQVRTDQTLQDFASHPTPLPGNQGTRTDVLSTIPFEDRKPDKKQKERKESTDGGKKSWWFLGSDDKEKEDGKKSKSKISKGPEKSHDNTRLDVLQSSIDGGRGRESVILDRDNLRLEEERKKESNRKSGEGKKEKDSGIFSSLFGGGKKKSDSSGKKGSANRGLSPEPPPRVLKPDIDYNWTRFSILEERAIYRMAHIKLANPRRELYSQVLLSNFMYSYLAKVQQMHPQIQIAQSPAQKQQVQRQMQQQQGHQQQQQAQQQQLQQQQQMQQQQQPQKEEQPDEFAQYQRYQEQQALSDAAKKGPQNGDHHQRNDSRGSTHSAIYNGNSGHLPNGQPYQVASGQAYMGHKGNKSQQPYYQQSLFDDSEPTKDDEMW